VTSRHVIKRCDGAQLEILRELVESGAIKPTIDRVFPLAQIQDDDLVLVHRDELVVW
jgi:NADPH:quinone reductase-like Zn-dependent oxidoreductase